MREKEQIRMNGPIAGEANHAGQRVTDGGRKYDIDNLRSFSILLLFPVHTFMIWNDFGTGFYIWEGESRLFSTLIVLVNPWFMPLLFVLAGMNARYALKHRTNRAFLIQRRNKLLLPFLGGILLWVPFQAWYARKYFFDNHDGLLAHWKYFFTHVTDLTGYDGAFTPGHLWFILFLFVISVLGLVLFRVLPYEKCAFYIERIPFVGVIFCFLPVWALYYLGNFGGFSLGKDLALYLLGYYVLSNEKILAKLETNFWSLTVLGVIGSILLVVLYARFAYYGDLWVNLVGWLMILLLLAVGRRYLNFHGRISAFLSRISYLMYLLHQTILVAVAYAVVQLPLTAGGKAAVICLGSFGLTIVAACGVEKGKKHYEARH